MRVQCSFNGVIVWDSVSAIDRSSLKRVIGPCVPHQTGRAVLTVSLNVMSAYSSLYAFLIQSLSVLDQCLICGTTFAKVHGVICSYLLGYIQQVYDAVKESSYRVNKSTKNCSQ